ncbi:prephenate dehydratase [Myxococcota bacterium]
MVDVTLQDIRQRIDQIDERLVDLLEQRAAAVAEGIEIKRGQGLPLHDPERERRVLERVAELAAAHPSAAFPVAAVAPVFREILGACLSVHRPLTVAYLGPPGTFTHMAAQVAFGFAVQYLQSTTIPGVFDAVARGSAAHGVVPIENSTEGGVSFTLDCLLDTSLMISSEVVLDVTQCLLSQHDDLGHIQRVYSHPQGLAQCREWLRHNLPDAQLVVSHSTTVAAREAVADPRAAAVASTLAAELNGLKVVRAGIQDRPDNTTRFVVLAESEASPTGRDKTSLVLSAPDERGALKGVLQILYDAGLNLTRIESRPRRGAKLWEYVFFTDLEGHRLDAPVQQALTRLAERGAFVKVLGSYPRAP